jgi:hypothetical protein
MLTDFSVSSKLKVFRKNLLRPEIEWFDIFPVYKLEPLPQNFSVEEYCILAGIGLTLSACSSQVLALLK